MGTPPFGVLLWRVGPEVSLSSRYQTCQRRCSLKPVRRLPRRSPRGAAGRPNSLYVRAATNPRNTGRARGEKHADRDGTALTP